MVVFLVVVFRDIKGLSHMKRTMGKAFFTFGSNYFSNIC